MITSDLLRYKIDYANNRIHPILCSVKENGMEYKLAKNIIKIMDEGFKNHYNKKEINEKIKILETTQNEYKLTRGIYSIIEKQCTFKSILDDTHDPLDQNSKLTKIKLDPKYLRKMIFQESALNGIAITADKRNNILENISKRVGTDIETINRAMWSDLEENTIIDRYTSPDPQIILYQYNISLIQTLLFNCIKMEIKIGSVKNIGLIWKNILRNIKRLGLMYWLDTDSSNNSGQEELICTIDGVTNIIKLTERYGSSIAKLVPLIFRARNWNLKADILRTSAKGNKNIYKFEITEDLFLDAIYKNNENIPQYKHEIQSIEKTEIENRLAFNLKILNKLENNISTDILFDSKIEKTFSDKFTLQVSKWTLEREPEPLITKSKTAFISDFLLSKYQSKIFVEIIGFWTREYLERKLQKILQIIQNYKDENFYMILIINFENLMTYEADHRQLFFNIKDKDNVLIISYKNENIRFKEIIDFLKKIERKIIDQKFENETEKLNIMDDITEALNKFKQSNNTFITFEDVNKTLKKKLDVFDTFNLIEAKENNKDFKYELEKKIIGNQLTLIKDFIFKDYIIKEIHDELLQKEIDNLNMACEFLSSKNIPEKIHIDILTQMGGIITWNGLDYSKSAIKWRKK
ncbi:MAG TPA: DUF790 family protein [Verrucomicrobiae bacterium]|nr:DUF790 family protein [Verrucomicrobiae bacterium]